MASPIVESLCCVPISSDLTQHFLSTFRTVPYNAVCLVTSMLGVFGAAWQLRLLFPRQSSELSRYCSRRPRNNIIKTNGPVIVRWLAMSDLCAASGIALRSALWLWDSAAVTGGLEDIEVSPGRVFCVALASWIHYFYTCTYLWTLLYCVDCVRGVRSLSTSLVCYHTVAWLLPALTTVGGLLGLYAPDLKCHSSTSSPYIRFLPNYLSTVLPLLLVLCVCPVLYCLAANTLHTVMAAFTGRYTSTERSVVGGVRRRFLLICLVFWLCWLPNVVNAAILWLAWDDLPYTLLTVLWYTMAVLNPLQAVFNCFVYPSQAVRSAHFSCDSAHRPRPSLCHWLLQVVTCGMWAWLWDKKKGREDGGDCDVTRDTDVVEHYDYEDLSSSEYQSQSSSPRTLGTPSPEERCPLLDSSCKGGPHYTLYSTKL